MKTTFKQYLQESTIPKASTPLELTDSLTDGHFTLDGSDIDTAQFSQAGDFYIVHRKIKSLRGCPKKVAGAFSCFHNNLTSLEFGPKEVGTSYYCGENGLTSLVGAPQEIHGAFSCTGNNLSSLKGGPVKVESTYGASACELQSLEGVARYINGDLDLEINNLTSLKDIHKQIDTINGYADFSDNPIKSHVLGLLKIKNLKSAYFNSEQLTAIINRHLPEGDIFACQQELIDAGFEECAQL